MECPFAKFGCREPVFDLVTHRKFCRYRAVDCPFGCDALLRFFELQTHRCEADDKLSVRQPSPVRVMSHVSEPQVVRDIRKEVATEIAREQVCTVPGCGLFYREGCRELHEQAFLKAHLMLIAQAQGDTLGMSVAELKKLLQRAADCIADGLCCVCREAEGDTIECSMCGRHVHEECDRGNMGGRRCFECRRLSKSDKQRRRDIEERHGAVIDLEEEDDDAGHVDDEDDEEDDEGGIDLVDGVFDGDGGPSQEQDLSGFVVGDDHVSWSSGDEDEEEDDFEEEDDEHERRKKERKQKKKERRKQRRKEEKSKKKKKDDNEDEDEDEVKIEVNAAGKKARMDDETPKRKPEKKKSYLVIESSESAKKTQNSGADILVVSE